MSNVLNRSTLEFLKSQHTPDFPTADWVINPDISPVAGEPAKYWVLIGDTLSVMDQAAKDALDASTAAAAEAAQKASVSGSPSVREYATTADLPLPPPKANLVVSLTDSGSATPGMAISTTTGWMVFASDKMVM